MPTAPDLVSGENSLRARVSAGLRSAARRLSLGLAILLFLLGEATAGQYVCSPEDVKNAAKDVYKSVPSSCSSQAANPAFYPLTAFLIAATQTPQGEQFCETASDSKAFFEKYKEKTTDVWSWLSDDQKKKLEEVLPFIKDAGDGAADAADGLSLISCACKVAQWKEPGKLYKALGTCFADGLCQVQDFFHEISDEFASCTGPAPEPPKEVDCTKDPSNGSTFPSYTWDSDVGWVGDQGQCFEKEYVNDKGYHAEVKSVAGFHCDGDICYSDGLLKSGGSTGGNYCYCPSYMQQEGPNIGDGKTPGNCYRFLKCACPAGSSPLSETGAGKFMCVCDSTGLPVGPDGKCPKPVKCDCPEGEVVLAKDYNAGTCTCGCPKGQFKLDKTCVSPCKAAGQVMLTDGSCCAAGSATSCGYCCPHGMKVSSDGTSCENFSINDPTSPPSMSPAPFQSKPIKP